MMPRRWLGFCLGFGWFVSIYIQVLGTVPNQLDVSLPNDVRYQSVDLWCVAAWLPYLLDWCAGLDRFSMAAGDFLDVYNDAEYVASLDVVVTCFFMDCAHNILDFMQTIHRVSEHTFF